MSLNTIPSTLRHSVRTTRRDRLRELRLGKSKPTVSVDGLVHKALLAIAEAEAPRKLTGKGGVFPSSSAAVKDAIAQLADPACPLVAETGSGKSATVSLTPAGFERIADEVPAEKLAAVVSRLASGLAPTRRIAFLQDLVRKSPQLVAGLAPLLEEAVAAEKAEAEERAREARRHREAEAASLAAIERWKTLLLDHKRQRVAALQKELAAEGVEVEVPAIPVKPAAAPPPPAAPASRSEPTRLPLPTDEEDVGFRRNVARRLVSSWVDAWEAKKPEAREFLEAAIWNVSGFRQEGEVGQGLKFDGAYHEGGAGLFTGDAVKVIRPGWVLEEADDRVYVVLKAQVAKG
jgi:hypothetical protein